MYGVKHLQHKMSDIQQYTCNGNSYFIVGDNAMINNTLYPIAWESKNPETTLVWEKIPSACNLRSVCEMFGITRISEKEIPSSVELETIFDSCKLVFESQSFIILYEKDGKIRKSKTLGYEHIQNKRISIDALMKCQSNANIMLEFIICNVCVHDDETIDFIIKFLKKHIEAPTPLSKRLEEFVARCDHVDDIEALSYMENNYAGTPRVLSDGTEFRMSRGCRGKYISYGSRIRYPIYMINKGDHYLPIIWDQQSRSHRIITGHNKSTGNDNYVLLCDNKMTEIFKVCGVSVLFKPDEPTQPNDYSILLSYADKYGIIKTHKLDADVNSFPQHLLRYLIEIDYVHNIDLPKLQKLIFQN